MKKKIEEKKKLKEKKKRHKECVWLSQAQSYILKI